MEKISKKYYLELSISKKTLQAINQELSLLSGLKLSPFARARREEMLKEAIKWPKGKSQEKRKITEIYRDGNFVIAAGKPGKEAAPGFN